MVDQSAERLALVAVPDDRGMGDGAVPSSVVALDRGPEMALDKALTGSEPEVVECVGRERREEFLSDIPCVRFSSRRFRDNPYEEVEPGVSERGCDARLHGHARREPYEELGKHGSRGGELGPREASQVIEQGSLGVERGAELRRAVGGHRCAYSWARHDSQSGIVGTWRSNRRHRLRRGERRRVEPSGGGAGENPDADG